MNQQPRRPLRAISAGLWTVFALLAVGVVDRACFPEKPEGWRTVATIDAVPANIRFDAIPTYLPNVVSWPPVRVFFREKPIKGWWYGLADAAVPSAGRIALWLGEGEPPYPNEIKRFTECMDVVRGGSCPPGWYFFSSRLKSGRVLLILSRLDPMQTKRILNALDISAR